MSRPAKTIIVTGASSGIGLAIARAFVQRGDQVVGNARTAERLDAAAARLEATDRFVGVAGDIALPETADRLFEQAMARFGHVDVLVNNAGIFNAKPFVEYTPDELQRLVDTNLKGFFYPSQRAARHMGERRQGHIINVTASIALQPSARVPAVLPVLVKGGINSATRALAIELASKNVQVNAVAPGIVDTPLYTDDMHGFLNTLQPAGRIASTQEIVEAVLYLADAAFTTGAVLPVDGGMSAGTW